MPLMVPPELVSTIAPPAPPALRCGTAARTGSEDTGEVDVDHVVPHLVGQLLDRREAGDAGVGQDDVQPAELRDALVDGRRERGGVPDVGLARDDAPAQVSRRGGPSRRGPPASRERVPHGADLLEHVDGDDVGALLRQPDGATAAETARRAGDENADLALSLPRMSCPSTSSLARTPAGETLGGGTTSRHKRSAAGPGQSAEVEARQRRFVAEFRRRMDRDARHVSAARGLGRCASGRCGCAG